MTASPPTPAGKTPALDSKVLPKIIWLLWLQGWDQAPEIVKACLQTWRRHNPGWKIETLSGTTVGEFLGSDEILSVAAAREIPHEALSDIIRIALLRRYGGVWADSTTYCLKPLDSWLYEHMHGGFLAFANPAPDLMLSSWFLAATRGNYLIERWYRAVAAYWSERTERDDYFWFHQLFAQTYRSDPEFRAIWDAGARFSSDQPHYYVPYDAKLRRRVTSRDARLLANTRVPLLKLTHRVALSDCPRYGVLPYLCACSDGRRLSPRRFFAGECLALLRSRVRRAFTAKIPPPLAGGGQGEGSKLPAKVPPPRAGGGRGRGQN